MAQHSPTTPESQPTAPVDPGRAGLPPVRDAVWGPIPGAPIAGLDPVWSARPGGAAPQPGGLGTLLLTLRPPVGGPLSTTMIAPAVTIDGWEVPSTWATNRIPVPAGPRAVTVESRYLWAYGRVQTLVTVPAGRTVELHYSGPLVSFGSGVVGAQPQPRPGRLAFVLILAAPVLLVALALLLTVIG